MAYGYCDSDLLFLKIKATFPRNSRSPKKKPRRSGALGIAVSGDHSAGVMLDACAPFGPWVSS